jgi:glutamine synthetase
MQPGHWAGAYACWGTENREAAVRYVTGGADNPYAANVEVKIIDPSANPYLASATVLGLALDGISRERALPAEITVDPATLTEEQRAANDTVLLPAEQAVALDALERSALMRGILGDRVVDAVVAVRRYEQQHFGDLSPVELSDRFRLAWSV